MHFNANFVALHVTIKNRKFQQTIELIGIGASTQITDDVGSAPLHLAVETAKNLMNFREPIDLALNTINLLLQHHADPFQRNLKGVTPFDIATSKQDAISAIFINSLIRHSDENLIQKLLNRKEFKAAALVTPAYSQEMLANMVDNNLNSLLLIAIQELNDNPRKESDILNLITQLVLKGLSPEQENIHGQTPYSLAQELFEEEKPELCTRIMETLESSANRSSFEITDYSMHPNFMSVDDALDLIGKNQFEAALSTIQADPKQVFSQDQAGNRPLHLAIKKFLEHGKTDQLIRFIITILLEYPTSALQKNSENQTPIDLASHDPELIELFGVYGIDLSPDCSEPTKQHYPFPGEISRNYDSTSQFNPPSGNSHAPFGYYNDNEYRSFFPDNPFGPNDLFQNFTGDPEKGPHPYAFLHEEKTDLLIKLINSSNFDILLEMFEQDLEMFGEKSDIAKRDLDDNGNTLLHLIMEKFPKQGVFREDMTEHQGEIAQNLSNLIMMMLFHDSSLLKLENSKGKKPLDLANHDENLIEFLNGIGVIEGNSVATP